MLESGEVEVALDEADIGPALAHRLGHLGGVADGEVELQPGMRRAEPVHQRRQPVVADGLAGVQRQDAAAQPGQVVQRALGQRRPGQHRPRFRQEGGAGVG